MIERDRLLLYAVTDQRRGGEKTLAEQVEAALRGGATMIQLREKRLPKNKILAQAIELAALCKKYGVPFLVNDSPEIAAESGADGVHVGQGDISPAEARKILGAEKIVGVTAKTVDQAKAAEAAGADYLGVGAAFATGTKADATVIAHSVYREIGRAVSIPIVAIGGITRDNLMTLKGSGIAGAALVSAIFSAEDIEAECRALLALCREMTEEKV
ncbi:MAG: thiamine phosphate synthase [Bacteroides sp.]|nr:thiamine phosphate synthase [Eubacterium sp.]MCM1417782.1 thiamine phosphate synthase [Roseburia sp.]MCM1461327.1 thiamine phosphate synthase [Bacteroides sp.]